jgi:hypothetical protein
MGLMKSGSDAVDGSPRCGQHELIDELEAAGRLLDF